jgi:secernin
MCDTIMASPGTTAGQFMLFGKNSDRQRNEAQAVEHVPRASYSPDARVTCTYIPIPQVLHTSAMILCRPFWMWGAEMGANEHGVVIGNEAVQARIPSPKTNALLGQDLIRLGLERSSSAVEAVDVITDLLERYGQGGNAGHLTPAYYNNSFIIADWTAGFVLETVGREWLLERVDGVRALSNAYSIAHAERKSAGMATLLRESGWTDGHTGCAADVIADLKREHITDSGSRRARSTLLLRSRQGRLCARDIMDILRDHSEGGESCTSWSPRHSRVRTLCLHAVGEDRVAQTTGSLVSEVHKADSVHWVTATAAPCISIFKPLFIDVPPPSQGRQLTGCFDPCTLWWRHERLHRTVILSDFAGFVREIIEERDAVEAEFGKRVRAVMDGGTVSERARVSMDCWREAAKVEDRWSARVGGVVPGEDRYGISWKHMNERAGLDLATPS